MQAAAEFFAPLIDAIFVELALFAGVCFVVAGIDEIAVDLIWAGRTLWRRLTVYARYARVYASDLPQPSPDFGLAVFIPAWDESAVIAKMICHAQTAYQGANVTIFVGCYANDAETIEAAESVSGSNVTIVVVPNSGPTTKADCLNSIWAAATDHERQNGTPFEAIILHDAEDVVSAFEAPVVAHLLPRFGLIQLPVVPLVDSGSRWISGHYCDEFAESHGKTLIVREALGAGLPLAGVGCAIRRDLLARLSDAAGGKPFDDASLTEDYETGLKLCTGGCDAAFVRMLERRGGPLVATRAHFPDTLEAAIQQKSRWIVGIGIAGWDRLGWGSGFAENWMRLRDRQGLFAGVALLAGYLAFLLGGISLGLHGILGKPVSLTPLLSALILAATTLFVWRLTVRSYFVGRVYGICEALRSIPRAVIANAIAILAARRAVDRYLSMTRKGRVEWDKTAHKFPEQLV